MIHNVSIALRSILDVNTLNISLIPIPAVAIELNPCGRMPKMNRSQITDAV
jgi:hypothetical protein